MLFHIKTTDVKTEDKPLPFYFKKEGSKYYFAVTSKDEMVKVYGMDKPMILLDTPTATLDGNEEEITEEEFMEAYRKYSKVITDSLRLNPGKK